MSLCLLDFLVDNYDRRRGQWRWMKLPGKACVRSTPATIEAATRAPDDVGLMAAAVSSAQPWSAPGVRVRVIASGYAAPAAMDVPSC